MARGNPDDLIDESILVLIFILKPLFICVLIFTGDLPVHFIGERLGYSEIWENPEAKTAQSGAELMFSSPMLGNVVCLVVWSSNAEIKLVQVQELLLLIQFCYRTWYVRSTTKI